MKELRIIIAGTRTFQDYELLKNKVKECIESNLKTIINEIGFDGKVRIISGTANGADKLGERYAKEHHLAVSRFPADWDKYGKRAGYIRNEQMAKFAVEDNNVGWLIAFWDGKSKGTKWMIDLARKNGLEVFVERYENETIQENN